MVTFYFPLLYDLNYTVHVIRYNTDRNFDPAFVVTRFGANLTTSPATRLASFSRALSACTWTIKVTEISAIPELILTPLIAASVERNSNGHGDKNHEKEGENCNILHLMKGETRREKQSQPLQIQ